MLALTEAFERNRRDAPAVDREARPAAPARAAAPDRTKGRRFWQEHPWAVGIGADVLLVALVAGGAWWANARHFETTDDAFIDARVANISPQVSGLITDVPVNDNQMVTAGTMLFRIDDRDYRAAVAQAQAHIDQAQASIATYVAQIAAQQSQVEQADRQVDEAQAALNFSKDENTRYQDLVKKGAGTEQRAQQAASDLGQKQAALASAQAAQNASAKQVAVLQAQQRSAQAQEEASRAELAQAQANLDRTTVSAPFDGRVTKLNAARGAYATPGQVLTILVPQQVWITANFKETQLTDMREGQPVTVHVDAYPGRSIAAHVDSIQAGSGTAFSLLPAENATGNFVKVVQRVPVKLVFDRVPDLMLGPGMSVEPSVRVR
jgi:membrane fusion protein (multidrug efflux system)